MHENIGNNESRTSSDMAGVSGLSGPNPILICYPVIVS